MTTGSWAAARVRTPPIRHVCEGCGGFFVLRQKGQTCCSARCRRRKSRHKRQERIEALAAEATNAIARLVAEADKAE